MVDKVFDLCEERRAIHTEDAFRNLNCAGSGAVLAAYTNALFDRTIPMQSCQNENSGCLYCGVSLLMFKCEDSISWGGLIADVPGD